MSVALKRQGGALGAACAGRGAGDGEGVRSHYDIEEAASVLARDIGRLEAIARLSFRVLVAAMDEDDEAFDEARAALFQAASDAYGRAARRPGGAGCLRVRLDASGEADLAGADLSFGGALAGVAAIGPAATRQAGPHAASAAGRVAKACAEEAARLAALRGALLAHKRLAETLAGSPAGAPAAAMAGEPAAPPAGLCPALIEMLAEPVA